MNWLSNVFSKTPSDRFKKFLTEGNIRIIREVGKHIGPELAVPAELMEHFATPEGKATLTDASAIHYAKQIQSVLRAGIPMINEVGTFEVMTRDGWQQVDPDRKPQLDKQLLREMVRELGTVISAGAQKNPG